jgi:hypothetical protein
VTETPCPFSYFLRGVSGVEPNLPRMLLVAAQTHARSPAVTE